MTQINVARPFSFYLVQPQHYQARDGWESDLLPRECGKRESADLRPADTRKRADFVSTPDDATQWLRRIDDALSSTSGAMLTLDRFDEVMRLRRKVRECCEAGRMNEARAAAEAAMAILLPGIHG